MKLPPIVLTLIALNAIIFGIGALLPDLGETILEQFALFFPQNEAFHLWQFFSYMFLHGNFAHILFNMFALASFGGPLVMIWGWRRFLVFYLVTGIGAGLVYTAVNFFQFSAAYDELLAAGFSEGAIRSLLATFQTDAALAETVGRETLESLLTNFHAKAVGASGAVYGILVAFGVLFPNAKLSLIFLPVPVAAKFFIPVLILLDLFSGLTGFSLFGAGIAHWAHIGGAAIGFLIMMYWKMRPPRGMVMEREEMLGRID